MSRERLLSCNFCTRTIFGAICIVGASTAGSAKTLMKILRVPMLHGVNFSRHSFALKVVDTNRRVWNSMPYWALSGYKLLIVGCNIIFRSSFSFAYF